MAGETSRSGSRTTTWTLGSLGALTIAALAAWTGFGQDGAETARSHSAGHHGSCAVGTLPEEVDEVISDIRAGGPFDHPGNDGVHFGNYEGTLPEEHHDFYREYTVETPGTDHRGARRIVTGGGAEPVPEVWYYTDDHYESFCEIPDAE